MLGAIVYFFLRLLGLDYFHHYSLTSALVSFLTSALVTALADLAVFKTATVFAGGRKRWALLCALIYGSGTTAFVYSGVTYHDALASGFLVIAFYCAVLLRQGERGDRPKQVPALVCGLLLGLTVTTSMLPFFVACVIAGYALSLRRWRLSVAVVLGGLIGIAPLLVFNSVSFGNPLLNSYAAGGYPESMLHFDWHNTIAKARLYVAEITLYVPIGWLGVVGLAFFPRAIRREQLVIILLLLAHAFQVLNIESHGGCHYGPRFLLPAMPFLCLGLAGFSYLKSEAAGWTAISATVALGLISVFISALGATYTAMYCDVGQYALGPALQNVRALHVSDFPLAAWLVGPCLLSLIFLILSIRSDTQRRNEFSPAFQGQ
jgi:4-amino-4-deoxy-L-arabinose transferase-like glycosyltransferase